MHARKTTTSKSCAAVLGVLCLLRAERLAMAETTSPFPPDTPPALAQPSAEPREIDVDSLRHRIGVQIGGSSYFQVAYRYRLFGGVFLDTGLFILNAGGDGSVGAVADVPIVKPFSVYAGAGVGFAIAVGATTPKGCDSKTTDCPLVNGSYGGTYVYVRLGTAVRFGRGSRHIVGVDGGLWRGWREEEIDRQVTSRSEYVSPMVGVSYHYAF
jgi:hypothetical protein